MEPQTRFDLNRALLSWKEEIAARPGVSDEDARELETHLLECLADLKRGGLSEAEAFEKARQRLGSTEAIAEEFARANPFRVWQDRLFWMAFAGLAVSIWGLLTGQLFWGIFRALAELQLVPFVPAMPVAFMANSLPVFIVAVLAATGRLHRPLRQIEWFVRSQARLAAVCLPLVFAAGIVDTLAGRLPLAQAGPYLFWMTARPLTFLALLVVLVPRRVSNTQPESVRTNPALPSSDLWRERVFWMAIGGLLFGTWRAISQYSMDALLYTGDPVHPYLWPALVTLVFPLLTVLPVILAAILAACKRLEPVTSRAGRWMDSPWRVRVTGLSLLMVCFGMGFLTDYVLGTRTQTSLSSPRTILLHYTTMFSWLWVAGLAALILWLAPASKPHRHEGPVRA